MSGEAAEIVILSVLRFVSVVVPERPASEIEALLWQKWLFQ